MADSPNPRPAKRVKQACINCRRKKAKCPGERPCCSYCSRLQQVCTYDEDPAEQFFRSGQLIGMNAGDLVDRISQIESKLNDISRSISSSATETSSSVQIHDFAQGSWTPSFHGDYNSQNHMTPGIGSFEPDQTISIQDIPKSTIDGLVNDYFRYSHNQLYSFFHEATFRANMSMDTVPEFLLSAVIMSALRFSHDQYFDSDLFFVNKRKVTADSLGRKAWKYISSKYVDGEEECTVAVVQAVTLLAIFEFIEGKQRTAWVKIGIGAKFAQDLCLMFEPALSLPFSEQEERRRTFWSIYMLDRLMTCGRARPPVFSDAAITVQLPASETAFRASIFEQCEELKMYTSKRIHRSPEPSPMSRVIIICALLSRSSQYAIQAQHDSQNLPPWDVESEWTAINSSLLYLESHIDWQQSVPDILRSLTGDNNEPDYNAAELVITSQILHHLCYCILNHYFLLRQRAFLCGTRLPRSFHIHSLQVGLYHAQELNRVMKAALRAGCAVLASFLSYACLISATIHAVSRHSEIPAVREQAAKDLNFNLSFLQRQARYWPNAGIIFNQITDFCRHSQDYKELISATPPSLSSYHHNHVAELADGDEANEKSDSMASVGGPTGPGTLSAQAINRMYTLIDYSVLSAAVGDGGLNGSGIAGYNIGGRSVNSGGGACWPAGLHAQDLEVDLGALT